MPRGENKEFQEKIGRLSMRLKRLNVERKLEAEYGSEFIDLIDIEAYLTEKERFSEIWSDIENIAEKVSKSDYKNLSLSELRNEVEKYKALAEKHEGIEFDAGELVE